MTRMLLTGGAGFIGSVIAQAALHEGWDVRVLDSYRADVHGGVPLPPPGVDLVRGDVREPGVLDSAMGGVELVCHQAAKVGLGVDISDAPDYASSNVVGTAEVLAAMARHGVSRLVMASSMVVYGEGAYRSPSDGVTVRPAPRTHADLAAGLFEPRDPRTGAVLEPLLVAEDAPLDPRNVYAATKLAQEHLASAWARETGGVAALLRYHNVYGPGMPRDTPYAGVASLFRSALERGEAPRVFEDGGQRRDFVHVRDVAGANLAAAVWTGSAAAGTARSFNVGSGTVTTILELAGVLARVSGGPPPVVTGQYRAGDVRHITASSARAEQELGWRAAIDFETGVGEFATAPLRA